MYEKGIEKSRIKSIETTSLFNYDQDPGYAQLPVAMGLMCLQQSLENTMVKHQKSQKSIVCVRFLLYIG